MDDTASSVLVAMTNIQYSGKAEKNSATVSAR
jgi:hypothetical protein